MIFILQILLISSLGYYYYSNRTHFNLLTIGVLVSKVFVGFIFVFIYQNYLKGDLSTYINLANEWSDFHDDFNLLLHNKGVDPYLINYSPRQLLFGKLFYMIFNSCFSNIYLTSSVYVLVSFVWIIESIKLIKQIESNYLNSFLIGLLVPTILFWSSGITKELFCFPAFIYIILFSYAVYKKCCLCTQFPLFILSFLLISTLRYFYLPLYSILVFGFLVQLFYDKLWFWIVTTSLCLFYVFLQDFLILQLQTKYINMLVYKNYYLMKSKSITGNYIDLNLSDDSLTSLIWGGIQSFKGMFFVSFKNILLSLVSLENVLVLVFTLFSLITYRRGGLIKEEVSLFIFIIVSAALFQLVSPNYGSLSRYRVVYWFFINWFVVHRLIFQFEYFRSKKKE